MIRFLDLEKQYRSIAPAINAAVRAVIADQAFIGGKYVAAFEEEFARFVGGGICVGVGNGTDALEIAIEALSLPPQSEIIVPANSFIATSEAVTRAGHRVVFCDCDPDTYTLSVADFAEQISSETRAVIPVHLYGQPCDMTPILDLAARHRLRVIEDCAQAHGAEYRGRRVGTFGDAATFSFYPGKNLGAYGDAGAIVCREEELACQCRMIANHGRLRKYEHLFEGRNSRLECHPGGRSQCQVVVPARVERDTEGDSRGIPRAARGHEGCHSAPRTGLGAACISPLRHPYPRSGSDPCPTGASRNRNGRTLSGRPAGSSGVRPPAPASRRLRGVSTRRRGAELANGGSSGRGGRPGRHRDAETRFSPNGGWPSPISRRDRCKVVERASWHGRAIEIGQSGALDLPVAATAARGSGQGLHPRDGPSLRSGGPARTLPD